MPTSANVITRIKTIVRAFYKGAGRDEMMGFREFPHPDFSIDAPNCFPSEGSVRDAKQYQLEFLPGIAKELNFNRFAYKSMTAEDRSTVRASTDSALRFSGRSDV